MLLVPMKDNSAQTSGEPTRRDRQAQETRAKLIETALDLFARQGVDNTSIKDIARQAGVAQGLLYHYFAGKDDLLWGVLQAHIFMPEFQQAVLEEDRSAEEVLRSIALQFNTFLAARQPLVCLIFRELQTNERVRALWEDTIHRETVSTLEEFLQARVITGELRPHRVEVAVHMLLNSVVTLHLPGGKRMVGDEEAIEEMVKILIRGLKAEAVV